MIPESGFKTYCRDRSDEALSKLSLLNLFITVLTFRVHPVIQNWITCLGYKQTFKQSCVAALT